MSNLTLEDLNFEYPENLVATEPSRDFRTLLCDKGKFSEINKEQIFDLFKKGDVLLINDTKVLPRRIFAETGEEILFLNEISTGQWQVLFPASRCKNGYVDLPGQLRMTLLEKGIPQKVLLSEPVDESYFQKHGELALPPYIQKARGNRNNSVEDSSWYQTAWANKEGSCAAPTASLHFSEQDLQALESRGVVIEKLTLHVGLGTFLPIKSENLDEHEMHSEYCEISQSTIRAVEESKDNGNKVFALGTTVTRAIESYYAGLLEPVSLRIYKDQEIIPSQSESSSLRHSKLSKTTLLTEDKIIFVGNTKLFIQPGFKYKAVDVLMTNFHQPKSTLLALVGAFTSLNLVKEAYMWAIHNNFRLFSYGDFSIWKNQ